MYSIANNFKTTVNELKTLNNLTSNTLKVGQVLRVPTTEEDSPTENTYIVKRGDTLFSIATRFNTTVDDLKKINNLTSNTLQIGQILKLKEENTQPNIYTVQKGDSLYSIARRYNTTVNRLKEINNLTSNLLQVGEQLLIEDNTQNQEQPSNTYTIKKGDSLYSIAKLYNTDVNTLKEINNLQNDILTIGQVLLLPNDIRNQTTYTVKENDTLYTIAALYNTDVNALKELNNLTSNYIKEGQKLILN